MSARPRKRAELSDDPWVATRQESRWWYEDSGKRRCTPEAIVDDWWHMAPLAAQVVEVAAVEVVATPGEWRYPFLRHNVWSGAQARGLGVLWVDAALWAALRSLVATQATRDVSDKRRVATSGVRGHYHLVAADALVACAWPPMQWWTASHHGAVLDDDGLQDWLASSSTQTSVYCCWQVGPTVCQGGELLVYNEWLPTEAIVHRDDPHGLCLGRQRVLGLAVGRPGHAGTEFWWNGPDPARDGPSPHGWLRAGSVWLTLRDSHTLPVWHDKRLSHRTGIRGGYPAARNLFLVLRPGA
eukprot:COSAG02_NODE_802_length_17030_cov_37.485500_2_plen_298_part_00